MRGPSLDVISWRLGSQILTSKVDHRTERIKIFIIVVDHNTGIQMKPKELTKPFMMINSNGEKNLRSRWFIHKYFSLNTGKSKIRMLFNIFHAVHSRNMGAWMIDNIIGHQCTRLWHWWLHVRNSTTEAVLLKPLTEFRPITCIKSRPIDLRLRISTVETLRQKVVSGVGPYLKHSVRHLPLFLKSVSIYLKM